MAIWRAGECEIKEMFSIEKSFQIFIMIYKYVERREASEIPRNRQVCVLCVRNLTEKLQWVISANLVKFFEFERNFHLKWPEPIKITHTNKFIWNRNFIYEIRK